MKIRSMNWSYEGRCWETYKIHDIVYCSSNGSKSSNDRLSSLIWMCFNCLLIHWTHFKTFWLFNWISSFKFFRYFGSKKKDTNLTIIPSSPSNCLERVLKTTSTLAPSRWCQLLTCYYKFIHYFHIFKYKTKKDQKIKVFFSLF
jgi:hypothetical protein